MNDNVVLTCVGRELEQQDARGAQGDEAQAQGQSVCRGAGAQPGTQSGAQPAARHGVGSHTRRAPGSLKHTQQNHCELVYECRPRADM